MRRDQLFSGLVSAIGIAGEAALLWHALVHTYPFKMFTYPPAEFFDTIGNVLAVVLSVIAFGLIAYFVRAYPVVTPPIATVVFPIFFAAALAAVTVGRYGTEVPADIRNFDGYTIAGALTEFASRAVGLSVGGLVLGGACSAIVRVIGRRQTAPPN